jgi:ABC-type multidrug transport system permease subunit
MSSIFIKEEMAVAMAPIVIMPMILFGGQFANSDNIQAWISWFQYLSQIRYSQEALVVNEFSRRTYNSDLILQNLKSGAIIQVSKTQ